MTTLRAVPPIGHPDRRQFEAAYREGDELLTTTMALDHKIELLRQYIKNNSDDGIPDLSDEIDIVRRTVDNKLKETAVKPAGKWTDLFRLASRQAFIEELTYVPAAFSEQRHFALRHLLTNGTYGVAARILEDALVVHDDPQLTPLEQGMLRGVINEQTAMALLNRTQSPSRIALPSTFGEDTREKTDLSYHLIVSRQTYVANIQVKSARPPRPRRVTPSNGLLVTARDMDNENNDFATSRAIIQEIYGAAGSEQLAELDATHAAFTRKVEGAALRVIRIGHLHSGVAT